MNHSLHGNERCDYITVLNLFFGIALFLFGMHLMSEHLKKMASTKAEQVLLKLTNHPLKGILVGTAVTSLIQSSSAVSAMAVGLTESRIIKLKQAIPIILGSILGTSVTGWIVAYSASDYSSGFAKIFSASVISAVFAIIGVILKLFIKKTQLKRLGETFLGFAILMLGIHTITQAVEPIKYSGTVTEAVTQFKNPLALFVVGIVLSSLLQSASASVGILQALSISGIIGFGTAVYLLLGISIGAAVPVFIAVTGKNADAKRCAVVYLLCNGIGAVIFGIIYLVISSIIGYDRIDFAVNSVSIAAINTIYRLGITVILTPFISVLEAASRGIVKDKLPLKVI